MNIHKFIRLVEEGLGLKFVKVVDIEHNHILARDSDALYLVILTNKVLRHPRSLGIEFNNEMFGIRRHYIDYELRHLCNYVIWVYRGIAYIAKSTDVIKFVMTRNCCIKRRYEVVCHYPVELCRKVTLRIGLSKFLGSSSMVIR